MGYTSLSIFLYLATLIMIVAFSLVFFLTGRNNGQGNRKLILRLNKFFLRSLTTYLALPFLILFIQQLSCETDPSDGHMYIRNLSQKCFAGLHYLNFIAACLGLILYLIYGFFTHQFYFETKSDLHIPLARAPSPASLIIFTMQLLYAAFSCFFIKESYEYPFLSSTLFLSLLLWVKVGLNSPYYNELTTKIFAVSSTVLLWTSAVIFASKVLQKDTIGGYFVLWFSFLPLVVLAMLSAGGGRVGLLLETIEKTQSAQKLLSKLNYLRKLCRQQYK